jgi:alpha-ketoglutarate-dependent 2,4-dichlorophenoxyacetate dioxygenase
MAMAIRSLGKEFFGEVTGVDAAQPLSPETVQEVVAGMDRYAVLVFPGQSLTQQQQLDFARNFGPLEVGFRRIRKGAPHRLEYNELADISNVGMDGKVTQRDDPKIVNNIANQLWHSDSSFQDPPARYSMLHAVVIPDKGGETEYCDLRAAYDALPDEMKREIAGLEAEHYALHSRFMLGDTGYTEEQRKALPPVRWPLVRTHPGSGRKLLWVGVHTTHVVGMTVAEGRMLLWDLLEHATQRQFVYQHRWKVGDMVMWDNRAVLHRGRRFDFSKRREMRRATTADAAS